MFSTGLLGSVKSKKVLGTWQLTFNTANVTLTAPSGASTNFFMPAAALPYFSGPLFALFGVIPNYAVNIGHSATFSRFQISTLTSAFEDTFTSLNTNLWSPLMDDPSGLLPHPPGTLARLSWPVSADSYTLQASPDLSPGSWHDPGVTNYTTYGLKMTFVPASASPGTNTGYFRLVK